MKKGVKNVLVLLACCFVLAAVFIIISLQFVAAVNVPAPPATPQMGGGSGENADTFDNLSYADEIPTDYDIQSPDSRDNSGSATSNTSSKKILGMSKTWFIIVAIVIVIILAAVVYYFFVMKKPEQKTEQKSTENINTTPI